MVEAVFFFGAIVVTVKDWDLDPAGIVTDAGTIAALGLDDESATVTPPSGALAASVAVPDNESPPTTLVRLRVNDISVATGGGGGGVGVFTVNVAVLVTPA